MAGIAFLERPLAAGNVALRLRGGRGGQREAGDGKRGNLHRRGAVRTIISRSSPDSGR
jgi:hypothetical protein